jgi:hypothetical protein
MAIQEGDMKKIVSFILIIGLIQAGLYAEDAVQVSIPEPTATNTAAANDAQSNAGWQAFRLTLDVDFTTVGMKLANDSMNDDTYVTGFGGGFIGVLDLGIAVYPYLLLGPRIGFLYCLPASFEHLYPDANPVLSINTKTSMEATLIPVEAGARLRFGIPGTTIALSTGAFAGVCFAHVANNVDVTNGSSQKSSYVQPYDGFGFSAEWNIAAEIKLMKGVDFNINGGYRMAGVINVKQSTDAYYTFSGETPVLVSSKNDILKNASGIAVPFDYSGINVGVGISLGF